MAEAPRSEQVRLQGVAELMLLEQRLRQAPNAVELGFLLVNDVRHLCPTDIAVLWLDGPRSGRIEAVANLPEPVKEAPFTQWMLRLCAHLGRQRASGGPPAKGAPRDVAAADLPAALAGDWSEFLPASGLWVPLVAPDGLAIGGLLLARTAPWPAPEQRVLGRLGETAAHALEALLLRRRRRLLRKRRRFWFLPWLLAVAMAGALLLPVPLTVLAPAEVVPDEPFVVRAPLDGVVKTVAVRPNQSVEAGQAVATLDDTDLNARLDATLQDLEIARAEYRQAQQTLMRDPEAASRIAVLAARIAQAAAEVDYVRQLLARIEVRAERAGIAIIPDRQGLIGKPVRIGERLMTIADPSTIRVEAWLAVADAVPLPEQARGELFLNVSADDAVPVELASIDYRAQASPSGPLAFRVVAELQPGGEPPRVGQRGTLKLFGQTVPLFRYLLRRPLAAMRPWLGL